MSDPFKRWRLGHSGRQTDFLLTSDELGTGVFIDLCHVNYGASLLGVAEGAQTFLDVASCRADSGDHGCFGITTQTLFQQPVAERLGFGSLCCTRLRERRLKKPLSNHVSTDSLYGVKTFFLVSACSDKAEMTFPRVSRDLLILAPSCKNTWKNERIN